MKKILIISLLILNVDLINAGKGGKGGKGGTNTSSHTIEGKKSPSIENEEDPKAQNGPSEDKPSTPTSSTLSHNSLLEKPKTPTLEGEKKEEDKPLTPTSSTSTDHFLLKQHSEEQPEKENNDFEIIEEEEEEEEDSFYKCPQVFAPKNNYNDNAQLFGIYFTSHKNVGTRKTYSQWIIEDQSIYGKPSLRLEQIDYLIKLHEKLNAQKDPSLSKKFKILWPDSIPFIKALVGLRILTREAKSNPVVEQLKLHTPATPAAQYLIDFRETLISELKNAQKSYPSLDIGDTLAQKIQITAINVKTQTNSILGNAYNAASTVYAQLQNQQIIPLPSSSQPTQQLPALPSSSSNSSDDED